MSSFEWMELQTLTADIAASRSRLSAARSEKDNRLTRVLEQEIGAAERRRDELLANITNEVAGAAEPAALFDADADSPAAPDVVAADGVAPDGAAAVPQNDNPQPPAMASAATEIAPDRAVAPVESTEGDRAVWEQVTPADIENARTELAARRAEMLARHAEELKVLDGDQAQLAGLAEAIEMFARKFKLGSGETPNAAVVTLEEERELRLQGRA